MDFLSRLFLRYDLAKLAVKPGEVVLVRYPGHLSPRAGEGLWDSVRAGLAEGGLPDAPVLVCPEDIDIRVLRVSPGDTVILRHPRMLTTKAHEHLRDDMEAMLAKIGLPDVPALVCEEGMDAQVLQVKPGDTLVVRHPRSLADPHKERLAASITTSLAEHGISGVAVVVLDEGASARANRPHTFGPFNFNFGGSPGSTVSTKDIERAVTRAIVLATQNA